MKSLTIFRVASLSVLSGALAFAGCEPVPYATPPGETETAPLDDATPMDEDPLDESEATPDAQQGEADIDIDAGPEGADVDIDAGQQGVDVNVEKENPDAP